MSIVKRVSWGQFHQPIFKKCRRTEFRTISFNNQTFMLYALRRMPVSSVWIYWSKSCSYNDGEIDPRGQFHQTWAYSIKHKSADIQQHICRSTFFYWWLDCLFVFLESARVKAACKDVGEIDPSWTLIRLFWQLKGKGFRSLLRLSEWVTRATTDQSVLQVSTQVLSEENILI